MWLSMKAIITVQIILLEVTRVSIYIREFLPKSIYEIILKLSKMNWIQISVDMRGRTWLLDYPGPISEQKIYHVLSLTLSNSGLASHIVPLNNPVESMRQLISRWFLHYCTDTRIWIFVFVFWVTDITAHIIGRPNVRKWWYCLNK